MVTALSWLVMAERVVPWDAGYQWEPNAPEAVLAVNDKGRAVLAVNDKGRAVLAVNAHPADPDEDCVVFVWSGSRAAIMGSPNDEARSGHRLYSRGLSGGLGAGTVEQSEWIKDLERRNRVHPNHDPARFARLTHFIVLLKEDTVEVIAEAVTVLRRAGPTTSAAAAILEHDRQGAREELPWLGYWPRIAWARDEMDRLLAPYAAAQVVIEVAGDVPDLGVPAGRERLMSLLRHWDDHPAERQRIDDQIREHLRSLREENAPPLING
jgi:hypothetical protein